MYSSRLAWDAGPNALSRLAEAKRRADAEILDLTGSNPTLAGDFWDESMLACLRDRRSLAYHPAPAGLPETREAIAAFEGVEASRILVTASTSEAYSLLFKLLCDPGDEIVVPRPSYPLFDFLAALDSVTVRHYSLRYHDGWWLDLASLESQITSRTRAVLAVNPNNPTGSYLKRSELEGIERICASREIALISDEVFGSFAFHDDAARVRTAAAEAAMAAFSLNGISKLLGLPQMKLGWIAANRPEAVERLELIADTYLSVSTPVQYALPCWLRMQPAFHSGLMERLRGNLDTLRSLLEPGRIEGGWYAVIRLPRSRGEEQWALDFLEYDSVLVQPGYFYDFESEAFAIVSLLTRPDVFREGLARMVKRIDEAR